MLRGKLDLDRVYFDLHNGAIHLVNGSLNAKTVEDALSVGEQFDRLRCAGSHYALDWPTSAAGQNSSDELDLRRSGDEVGLRQRNFAGKAFFVKSVSCSPRGV